MSVKRTEKGGGQRTDDSLPAEATAKAEGQVVRVEIATEKYAVAERNLIRGAYLR